MVLTWINFISLDGLEMANLLAADFCSTYELSFIYETTSASLFCSGYFACDHYDSQLIWPEWLGMMKKVCQDQTDLIAWHFDIFSTEKFRWMLCYFFEDILYVMTTFTVGSVMDLVMVFVLLLRQILLCNDNFIVGFLYNGLWGPSAESE